MNNDQEAKPLPAALKAAGTVFILFHLLALGAHVLSARSGPWWSPFGRSPAEPPQFASAISSRVFPWYLQPLRMTHDYHFATNRTDSAEAKFEIVLYDRAGRVVQTLNFPESGGNPWVRHRLDLLAQNLIEDTPIMPPQSESVAAPKKLTRTVEIWEPKEGGPYYIRRIPEHSIPRNRPVYSPSAWSALVAKSYVRYQCRLHDAASGELIRRSREPVEPSYLIVPAPPDFQEMVATFGKVTP
jgi:hypothetical protein